MLILWAVFVVPGFFFLLFRVTESRSVFVRMALGIAVAAATFAVALLLRSSKWSLFLAGMGALSAGLSLLVFREEWAHFNRRVFGKFMSWHRSEINSRTLVIVLGLAACAWGIGASIAAVVATD